MSSSHKRMPTAFVIAIDGPAGAGKSTIARKVAKELGFLYIDTGALYRALTLKAQREGLDFSNQDSLVSLARRVKIDLKNNSDGSVLVLLGGEDVSREIRSPGITKFVSDLAKVPGVRDVMLALQRRLGREGACVLDGRDIGTVVFPNANKKFFLDADFRERTNRRYKELKAGSQDIAIEDVAADLKNRDTIDSTRACAPLKKAEDAVYIDTTKMAIEEVVNTVLKFILMSNVKAQNSK